MANENDPIAAAERQLAEATQRIAELKAAKEMVQTDAQKAAEADRAKQVAYWRRNLTPGQAAFAEGLNIPK